MYYIDACTAKTKRDTCLFERRKKGAVSFYFDDDRNEKIPDDVTLHMEKDGEEKVIGTVDQLSDNVFYFEEEPDKTGNFVFDFNRGSVDLVKNLTNKIYTKQSELAGGNKKKAKKTKKAKKSKKAKKTQRKSIRSRRRRR